MAKKILSAQDVSGGPPKPDVLRFLGRMFPGPVDGPPRPNRQEQERALSEHRAQILARTDYLHQLAVAFRFDHKLDGDMAREVRQGIERRLVRLRELAADVRGYAGARRWSEAWRRYEDAERVAVNLDHWIARGRADAGVRRTASERAKAGRLGNEARRRLAEETVEAIARPAREYRRLHPDAPLSAVIRQIRRLQLLDESDSTIRRRLRTLGLT